MRKLELYGWHVEDLSSELLWILQHCAVNGPLLPNLKTLRLPHVTRQFLPFIPLVLSPRITTIDITFNEPGVSDLPMAIIASTITTLPTLCPNLREIELFSLPRDPMITAAVSGMFLASNRNNLLSIYVDSPLTEEAREVIYKLPNLHTLSLIIGRDTSSPPVALPNLIDLTIEYDQDDRWLHMFRGATLGKLERVTFRSKSKQIGDFLETFEAVALTTSIPATLSTFAFYTSRPWRPNYRSLLPFTQLEDLAIDSSCKRGCSSTIDDDIITDMARAMPKLQCLHLGGLPCQTPGGVTAKGLAALARYCPHLSILCIHFRAASFNPPSIPGVVPGNGPTIPQEDCALTSLRVGKIPVQEESTLMVALSLLRIFPRLHHIRYHDQRWKKVADAIHLSKQLADHSSKEPSLHPPRSKVNDTSPRGHTRDYLTKKRSGVPEHSSFMPTITLFCIHLVATSFNGTEYGESRTVERQTSYSKDHAYYVQRAIAHGV